MLFVIYNASTPVSEATMVLTHRGALRGAQATAGLVLPVFCFGVGFGIAARGAGLDAAIATTMSAVTFAGASQFVALDMWQAPLPWVALVVAIIGVNLRHVIYGATLYPWLGTLPASHRYLSVILLTDANWVTARGAFDNGERDAGVLLGSGVLLWGAWLGGTIVGAVAGGHFEGPARWGVDAMLPAFFACSLVGMRRDTLDLLPWLLAAATAGITFNFLPDGTHIIAGALAGGISGMLLDARY